MALIQGRRVMAKSHCGKNCRALDILFSQAIGPVSGKGV
jgi:hypothetical protein